MLFVTNDLCYVLADELALENWFSYTSSGADDQDAISQALDELLKLPVEDFLDDLSSKLATFDWRTSAASGLSEQERVLKTAYRGGSGYRELRRQLLVHLIDGVGRVADASTKVYSLIAY